MVDLAGSERLGKTQSKGATELEAMHINKSLTFLEQAVIALEDKTREHIPFRQSKLTHILKDSIGGKCHTVMLANIWGEKSQIEETVSIVLNIYISIGPWIYHDRVHSDSLCLLGCLSVYLQISLKLCCYYWHLVLPKGVHSNHPCQSICPFVCLSIYVFRGVENNKTEIYNEPFVLHHVYLYVCLLISQELFISFSQFLYEVRVH